MKKRYKKRVFDNLKTSLWFFFRRLLVLFTSYYSFAYIFIHCTKKLKICVFFSCVLFWKESSLTPRSFFVCVYIFGQSEWRWWLFEKTTQKRRSNLHTKKKTISRNTSSIWYGTYSIKNLFKEIENETKIWW